MCFFFGLVFFCLIGFLFVCFDLSFFVVLESFVFSGIKGILSWVGREEGKILEELGEKK